MLAEHDRRGWQIPLPQRPHSLFTMSLMSSPDSSASPDLTILETPQPRQTHVPDSGLDTSSLGRLPFTRRQVPNEWWSQTGSNRRPHACKARALPTELWPHGDETTAIRLRMVGLGRLERPTSPLSGVRSNHLSYRPEPHPRLRTQPDHVSGVR